jgi:two-component system, cell cycle sensor histidine kinase and response regulator CckA
MAVDPRERPIRVLLVEDDEDDYIICRDLLTEVEGVRYDLEWVASYSDAMEAIETRPPDVCLTDYRFGEYTGLDMIREARRRGSRAPMILLTGQGDHRLDLEAMEAGAADYLVKGQLDAVALERSIRYTIQRWRAEEALRESEERLRQAQKMEAVGRLAGGVAHDFNNMLGAITGYADLLLHRTDLDEMVRDCLKEIVKAGDRAAGLTRQLLAFSRKSVLAPRTLDLNEVVTGLYPMLRRLINDNVELVTLPDPTASIVKVDPGQIEQVLLNLVVNARDAMPGGGTVTIRCRTVHPGVDAGPAPAGMKPGPYVLLEVSDTGCGMDPVTQARIFEPFFTTKESGKGTGLGLATVYGIVEQSGGQIDVESQLGVGSTFRIFLPWCEEGPRAVPRPEAAAAVPQGSETILLVEDEPIVRKMVFEVLRRQGYSVLEALQGDDALRLCQAPETSFDLLLTDVMVPGMSGRELAERVTVLRPDTKILFMSGYTDDPALRSGVSGASLPFIQKPFKPPELARKVREVLGDGRRGTGLH